MLVMFHIWIGVMIAQVCFHSKLELDVYDMGIVRLSGTHF